MGTVRHERMEHFFRVKYKDACYIGYTLFPLSISWMLLLAVASKAVWKNELWMVCLFTMGMRLFPLLLSWSSKWLQYSTVWIFPLAVLAAFGLEWFLKQKRTRRLAEILSIATITWLAVIYLLSFDKQLDLRWKSWTIYSNPQMQARYMVRQSLEQIPGKHLLFVQYSSSHSWGVEWVYNGPEIDAQKIVWAHDLGAQEDRRLMNYYPNREIWLVTGPDSPKLRCRIGINPRSGLNSTNHSIGEQRCCRKSIIRLSPGTFEAFQAVHPPGRVSRSIHLELLSFADRGDAKPCARRRWYAARSGFPCCA